MQTYQNNDEVMDAVKECAKGVPMNLRSNEEPHLTNNYVKGKIKEKLGIDIAIMSAWDETLTMSNCRVMMNSPYNGKILSFAVNL